MMITNASIKQEYNDKQIELFERLKMCLMLNELYNKYKKHLLVYKNNGDESHINFFQLRQLSFAYIYVVIETINNISDDILVKDCYSEIQKILNIKIDEDNISDILKRFRNKTFHSQKKSFSNTKELYNIYFDDLDKKCEKIINIFEKMFSYIISDKEKMINATFRFYESEFYSKLKNVGDKK